MRYLILFLVGAGVIYACFLVAFTGPTFALYVQPLLSVLLSGVALFVALFAGLSTRWGAVPRFWHDTPLGASIALLAIVFGWIALIAAFTASDRATLSNAILGMCGLTAIDFGILHWPNARGLTNR